MKSKVCSNSNRKKALCTQLYSEMNEEYVHISLSVNNQSTYTSSLGR